MHTTTLTNLELLQNEYSDFHKEVHGFRPRLAGLTEADLEAEIEQLHKVAVDVFANEKAEKDASAQRFEVRVQATIEMGAGDRETALRWIMQAEDVSGDRDYLCFKLNLPYGYLNA